MKDLFDAYMEDCKEAAESVHAHDSYNEMCECDECNRETV